MSFKMIESYIIVCPSEYYKLSNAMEVNSVWNPPRGLFELTEHSEVSSIAPSVGSLLSSLILHCITILFHTTVEVNLGSEIPEKEVNSGKWRLDRAEAHLPFNQ